MHLLQLPHVTGFMSRSEVGGEPVRTTCELVPTSGKFDRS